MARGDTRGVPVAAAILLGIAAISGTVGVYVGNQGGSPTPWFTTSGVSIAIAVLVYVISYWILPHFRGSRTDSERPPIKVTDSPDAYLESNAPRDNFGEIEIDNSPGATLLFNDSEESGEESDADANNSDPNDT